jgi:CO/xanthine dehydrogenase FAD-binding subunit
MNQVQYSWKRRTLRDFSYIKAHSLDEALENLSKYKEECKVLAGGTDLIPLMKARSIFAQYIIDVSAIDELKFLKVENDYLRIGAATKISDIVDSKVIENDYAALYKGASQVGDWQVRNMATIGGNIGRASPSSDLIVPLLALNAEIVVRSIKGERHLPLPDVFTAPGQTVLESNELITEIRVPASTGEISVFENVTATHENEDVRLGISGVSAAVMVKFSKEGICEKSGVALGAVAPTPLKIKEAEELMEGQLVKDCDIFKNEEVIEKVLRIVADRVKPITDVRSTEEYRKIVSRNLVNRCIKRALEIACRKP